MKLLHERLSFVVMSMGGIIVLVSKMRCVCVHILCAKKKDIRYLSLSDNLLLCVSLSLILTIQSLNNHYNTGRSIPQAYWKYDSTG
jgi:hypothetical protein